MKRVLVRPIAAFAMLLGAGWSTSACTELVGLGDQCPIEGVDCAPTRPGGEIAIPVPGLNTIPIVTPSLSMDASIDSGAGNPLPDAVASDAGVEADFPLIALQNASFERNGGIGGDVVLSAAVSTLVPVAPVDTVFAELPHWFACIPLSVSSLTWMTHVDAGTPSASGDYLSFVINGTTVREGLTVPLMPGTTYSLTAEVMNRGGGAGKIHLEVRGATTACGAGYVLGRSPVIPETTDWTSACVTFTADKPYTYLLLAPSADGSAPPGNARFYLDELRQVASCPSAP